MSAREGVYAAVVSDAEILRIIEAFTELYGYAPDRIDIAARCGYATLSMRNRLRKIERRGLLQRVAHDAMAEGTLCTWQVVKGA